MWSAFGINICGEGKEAESGKHGDVFTTRASAKPAGSFEPWVALQSWEKGWGVLCCPRQSLAADRPEEKVDCSALSSWGIVFSPEGTI